MTDEEIRRDISFLDKEIAALKREIEVLKLKRKHLTKICPHSERERWSNDDGEGSFTVEKCKICGLQRDGGLGPRRES